MLAIKIFCSALFILSFGFPFVQAKLPRPFLIDVQHYEIKAELILKTSFLRGEAKVQFKVLEDSMSLPFELNNRLSIIEITDEKNTPHSLEFDNFDSSQMLVRSKTGFKSGEDRRLDFRFEGTLEPEDYAFLDAPRTERAVISSEGAVLLTEGNWFPVHRLPLDAATATVSITVPLGFTVVAPGTLQEVDTLGVTETFIWEGERPVTGVPVVVARYFRQQFKDQMVPVTFFVTENFNRDLRPIAEEIEQMLDFYQEEYGDYPERYLNLVQVGNVELSSLGCAGLILLEAAALEASEVPIVELAKRVAQQWWGYSVRIESANDAWLQEGFATYAALRYIETNYPDRFSVELSKQAVQALKYESKAPITRGLELGIGSAQYNSIVASKGAWVLYMLGQLGGKERLDSLLGKWFRRNTEQTTSTSEFLNWLQEQTGENYRWFFVQWLESVGIPEFRVDYTIYKLKEGGFRIRGEIKQDLELFKMSLDVVVETKGQSEEKILTISGKNTSFTVETETLPVRLQFDPHGKILSHSPGMRVKVFIALGEEYQQEGELLSAIREYEKAKKLDPRSSLAHYRVGEGFFEQRSYSSAANSFRNALNGNLQPDWVETWTHIYLGKIYDILGQRQRALAEYQKVINSKIDYNSAQAEAQKYLKEPYAERQTIVG